MFGWIAQRSFQQLRSQNLATTPDDSGGKLWRKIKVNQMNS